MEDFHLSSVSEYDPEEVTPDDIDVAVVRDALASDRTMDRVHAAQLAFSLAAQDADIGEELTPALVSVVEDAERAMVLKGAFGALTVVAEERPAVLRDDIGVLVDGLTNDLPLIRMLAARTLRPVGAEQPDAFTPHVKALLAVLRRRVETPMEQVDPTNLEPDQISQLQSIGGQIQRRQVIVEGITANLVAAVAEVDPDAVHSHLDMLVTLLEDDLVEERTPIVDAIKSVGEVYPENVVVAVDPLCDLLESSDQTEAVHVISALGYIGDSAAVSPLQSVAADEEREEDVRELAAETAEWVQESG